MLLTTALATINSFALFVEYYILLYPNLNTELTNSEMTELKKKKKKVENKTFLKHLKL